MQRHRLRREILAMRIANEVVNRLGPAYALRAAEDTATSIAKVVRAYAIAREVFDIRPIWSAIEAADGAVPPALQYELLFQIGRLLRRAAYWLLQRHPHKLVIGELVGAMRPQATAVLGRLLELETPSGRQQVQRDIDKLVGMGVSPALAHKVAARARMTQTLDIIEVAGKHGLDVPATARLYFQLARGLELDWIREEIEDLTVESRWQAVARDTLRQNLARQHSAVLGRILNSRAQQTPQDALLDWFERRSEAIARVRQIVQDMRAQEGADFATLSVAIREIERLA
jgi:glutamate dehydrogenase